MGLYRGYSFRGYRVWGFMLRVLGLGLGLRAVGLRRLQGLGWDLRFRVWGLGFGV